MGGGGRPETALSGHLSRHATSTLPSGLAQALEHVGVVFRPMPWYAPANKYLERGRRDCNGLLDRFLRFHGLTDLAEGGGEPAVGRRKIGVGSDPLFRRLDRRLVFAAEIKTQRH